MRISWFFLSCSRTLEILLELLLGTQESARLASEKSGLFPRVEGHVGIPLGSLQANGALSRVQSAIQET